MSRRRPLSSSGTGAPRSDGARAHHPMTHTGPYDAIFDTFKAEDREVASKTRASSSGPSSSSPPSLPSFLRFAIAALLAMKSWRVSHQCGRESTRTAFHLLQHNEKNSVPLNEMCIDARERRASSQATTTLREARALIRARSARHAQAATALQKISMKYGFLARIDNVHRDRNANANRVRARRFFLSICFADGATLAPKKICTRRGKNGSAAVGIDQKTANQCQVIRAARRYRLPRFTAAASGDWHHVRNFCRARRCARVASALRRRVCV